MRTFTALKPVVTGLALLLLAGALPAQSSNLLHFQARLNDAGGVPINGPVSYTVAVWDGPGISDNMLWSEAESGTALNGVVNTLLGANTALPAGLFDGGDRWMAITVGADPEMTPRAQIGAAPYARHAENVDGADLNPNSITINGSPVIDAGGNWIGSPTGLVGPTGPAGPAGADGSDGADGADGAPGADGADGNDGAPGADGADGNDGAPGATGATGAAGATGPAGPAGNDTMASSAVAATTVLYSDANVTVRTTPNPPGGSIPLIVGNLAATTYQDKPLYKLFNNTACEIIYTDAELGGQSGTITKIAFFQNANTAVFTEPGWEIRMKDTATATLTSVTTATPEGSTGTLVVGPGATLPSSTLAAGWYEITLTTPFAHTAGNNLLIYFREALVPWVSGPQYKYTTTATTMMHYAGSDSLNPPTSFTATTSRPNIEIFPFTAIAGPPQIEFAPTNGSAWSWAGTYGDTQGTSITVVANTATPGIGVYQAIGQMISNNGRLSFRLEQTTGGTKAYTIDVLRHGTSLTALSRSAP